ncbi:MarR family winged helix-turn-helix transcriptional regulator [Paracoccus aminophilus]|nr:MarR family transcriptional regulator [Paracoccus aminophilus]
MDWDLFENPVPLINMAARSFSRLGERRVKPLGFSVGQLPVLYLLKDGRALAQKELARLAKMEQPSMAQLLARMERDGLIARSPDPEDRRSSLISLTESARGRIGAVRAALDAGNGESFADFSAEELALFVGLLRRLNSRLDRLVVEDQAGASI